MADHCVYFIAMAAPTPVIKVGLCLSGNMRSRLQQTQTHTPYDVKLLGAVKGDRKLERAMHLKLIAFHVRGEWFQDNPVVRAFINEWMLTHPHASGEVAIDRKDHLRRFKVAA